MTHSDVINKYHISRLGRKLCVDDQRVLSALPRDVIPERTWAEILQKEDTELIVLELREEIVERVLHEGYQRYMERQTAPFVAHCAAKAWLQLIDWHFYRHDPGEDPTAHPPCSIPRRADSWIPDEMPEPSPKDSWARENLNVVEEVVEGLKKATSSESLDVPVVEEIPRECWFPGKVQLPGYILDSDYDYDSSISFGGTESSDLAAESELLQKVTDYSPRELLSNVESATLQSASHSKKGTRETSPGNSFHGGGDSNVLHSKPKWQSTKSKLCTRSSMAGRSNVLAHLPVPSDSRSRISVISDRRLRSLRLETQYEVASERIESTQKLNAKRK